MPEQQTDPRHFGYSRDKCSDCVQVIVALVVAPEGLPLAYCLSITLPQRLRTLAGGLMLRVVFEKLATVQLLDVRVPTTDRRELLLVRRTEPERDVALPPARLKLALPPQPPPRIVSVKTTENQAV